MAEKRNRMFALFGAVLFLFTSSALTIAVVYSMIEENKAAKTASSATPSTNKGDKTVDQKLAGTPLAGFTPLENIPELKGIDSTPGTGEVIKAGETVTVDYTGAVASTGVIFQSSKDTGQTVSFGLDQVIKGWTNGIPGMQVGGTRRLLIPSDLAYGANPPGGSGIPANADLVFDVTVYKVGK